jgi:hypothetical protein
MQDSIIKGDWERMRLLATISIMPWTKTKVKPEKLLPLPWDKPKTKKGLILSKSERKQRFEKLINRHQAH